MIQCISGKFKKLFLKFLNRNITWLFIGYIMKNVVLGVAQGVKGVAEPPLGVQGVAETTPMGTKGGQNHHQNTIGGGFGHPLDSMGVAEPPRYLLGVVSDTPLGTMGWLGHPLGTLGVAEPP
jgi:hypothetical protein